MVQSASGPLSLLPSMVICGPPSAWHVSVTGVQTPPSSGGKLLCRTSANDTPDVESAVSMIMAPNEAALSNRPIVQGSRHRQLTLRQLAIGEADSSQC